jgi:hypothetical protein
MHIYVHLYSIIVGLCWCMIVHKDDRRFGTQAHKMMTDTTEKIINRIREAVIWHGIHQT